MKKNLITIIAMIIVIACFYGVKYIASSGEITVENFDAVIDIDTNGDMSVSETWVVNWPSGMSVSFRDIGYNKYNQDDPLRQDAGDTANFMPNVSVEVFDKDFRKLSSEEYRVGYSFNGDRDELGNRVECYPLKSDCESIFIEVYDGMDSQMTFKYNYKIEGAVTEYMDTAELNWNLLNYFENGINKASVEINLPNVSHTDINAWGHGLGKGNVIIEESKVILDIDRIKNGEFLEFRILFPENKVAVDSKNKLDFAAYETILKYQQDLAIKTNKGIQVARIIFYGVFVIGAISLFALYYIYNKYDKEHKAKFDGKYFRELPAEYSPAEMSYLYYFKKINNEDLTATLLDLIRRKHLTLDTDGENINKKNPNFKIIFNQNSDDKLLPHEKHLITWFIAEIGNGKEVTLQQIETYPKGGYEKAKQFEDNAKTFVRLAKTVASKHDFFDSSSKGKAYGFVLIPFVYAIIAAFTEASYSISNTFAIVVSVALTIGLFIYISTIQKRSVNGNEDYVKWKAFKNFLEDFGNMRDYPMPGIVIWEHYLVYATSLKVADKVMQQLEVRLPNIEETEGYKQSTFIGFGHHYYGFHFGYTLGRLNNTVNTARRTSFQTIQAHNAAKVSGVGRGGGFGGGSSFGGGGGGFRGR